MCHTKRFAKKTLVQRGPGNCFSYFLKDIAYLYIGGIDITFVQKLDKTYFKEQSMEFSHLYYLTANHKSCLET